MTLCAKIAMNIACKGWPQEEHLVQLAKSSIGSVSKIAKLKYGINAELSLLFSNDEAICALNKQFRDIDKPTNVLSFPNIHNCPGDNWPGDNGATILGDIAFGLETIKTEADLEGKVFNHHLRHLMIHGFLHLFGYDHQNNDDAEEMETLEIAALADIGIDNPYAHKAV